MPKSRRLMETAHDRLVRDIMPMESYVSIGVPVLRDGRLTSAHFASLTRLLADRSNSNVFSPNYRAYVDWQTEEIVGLDPLAPVSPPNEAASLGHLLPAGLAGQWTDEKDEAFAQARQDAFESLDVLGPAFAERDDAAAPSELRRHYLAALGRLVSEVGLALYRELNPDFFTWLEGGAAAPSAPPSPAPGQTRFCINCGAPRAEGRFCTNCGTPFAD